MICVACQRETESAPCTVCGEQPLLAGKYALMRRLATDGRTTTWLGRHNEQRVAIEATVVGITDIDSLDGWLNQQIQVARGLHHPAFPHVLEGVVRPAGTKAEVYRVREYVDGRTLAVELDELGMQPVKALQVIAELAEALSYLHELEPPLAHGALRASLILRREGEGSLVLLGGGLNHPFQPVPSPDDDLEGLGLLAVRLLTRQEPESLRDSRRHLTWAQLCALPPALEDLIDSLAQPEREPLADGARDLARRLRELLPSMASPMGLGVKPVRLAELGEDDMPTAVNRRVALSELAAEDVPTEVLGGDLRKELGELVETTSEASDEQAEAAPPEVDPRVETLHDHSPVERQEPPPPPRAQGPVRGERELRAAKEPEEEREADWRLPVLGLALLIGLVVVALLLLGPG